MLLASRLISYPRRVSPTIHPLVIVEPLFVRALHQLQHDLLSLIKQETAQCEQLLSNILPPHLIGSLASVAAGTRGRPELIESTSSITPSLTRAAAAEDGLPSVARRSSTCSSAR